MMTSLQAGPYSLSGLGSINVLLGKNGVGKSVLLRTFGEKLHADARELGKPLNALYITPERGGEAQEDHQFRNMLSRYPEQVHEQSRVNFSPNYRAMTTAKFAHLIEKVRERFEADTLAGTPSPTFTSDVLAEINALQHRLEIKTDGTRPVFINRDTGRPVPSQELSSGEKELFCLAGDLLYFEYSCPDTSSAIVLIDEPDVHIHPDMQARVGALVASIARRRSGIQFIIATHSTAFISGMASHADIHVAFMQRYQQAIEFRKLNNRLRQLVPVFGAHPLSSLFNERPLLLVEGDDDEWMWHRAVRSSNKRIWLNPVSVDGKPNFKKYEAEAEEVLSALYDEPRAYSLRDSDGILEPLHSSGAIRRLRLTANETENLLLSDEVLEDHGFTWVQFQEAVAQWLVATEHKDADTLRALSVPTFDRCQGEVKSVRVLVAAILGSNAPIPVLLGKSIAKHCFGSFGNPLPTSIKGMIGRTTYEALISAGPHV